MPVSEAVSASDGGNNVILGIATFCAFLAARAARNCDPQTQALAAAIGGLAGTTLGSLGATAAGIPSTVTNPNTTLELGIATQLGTAIMATIGGYWVAIQVEAPQNPGQQP